MLWRTTEFNKTYFFITADLGGGEKWTFIFVNEMKQTKT